MRFVTGNIFQSNAAALVNPVNCAGVMGKGLALHFKRAFPDNFKAYKAACAAQQVRLGEVWIYDLPAEATPTRCIINFPTKKHWRSKSKLPDVEAGLHDLAEQLTARKVPSVAVPPLGCGLGGLAWADVRARIVHHLDPLEGVEVTVYEPL